MKCCSQNGKLSVYRSVGDAFVFPLPTVIFQKVGGEASASRLSEERSEVLFYDQLPDVSRRFFYIALENIIQQFSDEDFFSRTARDFSTMFLA
jgi:hypothetical protein